MRERIKGLVINLFWKRERVWKPCLVVWVHIQIILNLCSLSLLSCFTLSYLQKKQKYHKDMLSHRENCHTIWHSRSLLYSLRWSLMCSCCIYLNVFGATKFTITSLIQNISSRFARRSGLTKKVLLVALFTLGVLWITWVSLSNFTMWLLWWPGV